RLLTPRLSKQFLNLMTPLKKISQNRLPLPQLKRRNENQDIQKPKRNPGIKNLKLKDIIRTIKNKTIKSKRNENRRITKKGNRKKIIAINSPVETIIKNLSITDKRILTIIKTVIKIQKIAIKNRIMNL